MSIAYLSGHAQHRTGASVIFVAGAIGYLVVDNGTFTVPSAMEIFIYEVERQNMVPILYGFPSLEQRELAVRISGLRGIGPSKASRIVHTQGDLTAELIATGNGNALAAGVAGVSAATAHKICASLAGVVSARPTGSSDFAVAVWDAVNSLVGKRPDIKRIQQYHEAHPDLSVEDVVSAFLSIV